MSIRCQFVWLAAFMAVTCSTSVRADSPITLRPKIEPGDMSRVTVELELGGKLQVRRLDAEKNTLSEPQSLPMSVVGKLRYDERRLTPADDTPADHSARGVRYYDEAEATIKVDDGGQEPSLPDDRRLIVVERADDRTTMFCPEGPLTREQLDLIDTVGNTLLLHELLPTEAVAEDGTWKQSADVMAGLLTLDSIAACEVESVLEQFNKDYAKVRLAGTVDGSVDGAATEMEVRAVYLFDRRRGRITRVNWAIKENRSIGGATPGVEGIAKLRMTLDPIEKSDHLTDEVVGSLPAPLKSSNSATDAAPPKELIYEAPQQGFRVHHDRQWLVTGEERETITLGRVDRTGLVAHCSLTLLPPKSAGRYTSLEEFQNDIARSLGKSYGQLASSRQWTTPNGLHCLEVVVRGQVRDVPVEWRYYLLSSDEADHRITMAVTVEGEMVGRLGKADRELVESLELIPVETPSADTAQPSPPADETDTASASKDSEVR